jgi:hypothetical protein
MNKPYYYYVTITIKFEVRFNAEFMSEFRDLAKRYVICNTTVKNTIYVESRENIQSNFIR